MLYGPLFLTVSSSGKPPNLLWLARLGGAEVLLLEPIAMQVISSFLNPPNTLENPWLMLWLARLGGANVLLLGRIVVNCICPMKLHGAL